MSKDTADFLLTLFYVWLGVCSIVCAIGIITFYVKVAAKYMPPK